MLTNDVVSFEQPGSGQTRAEAEKCNESCNKDIRTEET